jgi:transposase InsO family protein
VSKVALARSLGVCRQTLYYVSKKDRRDWKLKARIETVLREHPAYGSRRIAQELTLNRKGVRRVMRRFGIRPYRRRGRKWRTVKRITIVYPNLLRTTIPAHPHHVWAADFTELVWKERKVYIATVLELFTRQIVGVSVALRKGAPLTIQALAGAILHHPCPEIFHSDNGREYEARAFVSVLTDLNVLISRTHPGCPWENGYQESFYGKFKTDLGDPNRFRSLGELAAEIYRTIWAYNNTRIHSALKMPPKLFAQTYQHEHQNVA